VLPPTCDWWGAHRYRQFCHLPVEASEYESGASEFCALRVGVWVGLFSGYTISPRGNKPHALLTAGPLDERRPPLAHGAGGASRRLDIQTPGRLLARGPRAAQGRLAWQAVDSALRAAEHPLQDPAGAVSSPR
jgi:hypothetical protein